MGKRETIDLKLLKDGGFSQNQNLSPDVKI